MKPTTESLSKLLDRDSGARRYFDTLPIEVQFVLRTLDIYSFEELQAQSVRILYVPF